MTAVSLRSSGGGERALEKRCRALCALPPWCLCFGRPGARIDVLGGSCSTFDGVLRSPSSSAVALSRLFLIISLHCKWLLLSALAGSLLGVCSATVSIAPQVQLEIIQRAVMRESGGCRPMIRWVLAERKGLFMLSHRRIGGSMHAPRHSGEHDSCARNGTSRGTGLLQNRALLSSAQSARRRSARSDQRDPCGPASSSYAQTCSLRALIARPLVHNG